MNALAFERDDGTLDLPIPRRFVNLLRSASRLQCVFLNACHTRALGEAIVEELPHLRVLCWDSITRDDAARAFSRGFFEYIGKYLDRSGRVASIEGAFEAAKATFTRCGGGSQSVRQARQ